MTDLIAQQDSLFEQVSTYASAYRSSIGEHVGAPQSYGDALRAFDGPTPECGRPPHLVIADLICRAEPGLRATTGPRFFGWVIGASHPVGVAADWLTSVWDKMPETISQPRPRPQPPNGFSICSTCREAPRWAS